MLLVYMNTQVTGSLYKHCLYGLHVHFGCFVTRLVI